MALNKSVAYLILIFILFLIILSILLFINEAVKRHNEYNSELNKALKTNNPDSCEKIKLRDICYMKLAGKLNNQTLCEKAGKYKEDCLEQFN